MGDSRRLHLGGVNQEESTLRIGQFELEECIGDGSMGEVWRGRHIEQNVEVAVKVIVSDQALNLRFQRAFLQEARSVAGLSHPFVVDVYDYGKVDERAEDISLGHFKAGSPYLAMEYARHGSLSQNLNGPARWGIVRLVLFSVLDALAHSHARGVVHRDIKPQNVLLSETRGRPGIRVTDYGLAYALRDTQDVANWHRSAGTPEYMAPEQVTGEWRKYGPSTDLYAVGCLAYEMLTGEVPFPGNNMVQIVKKQLEAPLPQLPPHVDAPAEMQEWLEGLLQKDSTERFRAAAEAACALRQFGGAFDEREMKRDWTEFIGDTALSSPEREENVSSIMPTHSLSALVNKREGDKAVWCGWTEERGAMPPIPSDWRRDPKASHSVRLAGTGSGLFGLRRLPILGREQERENLWKRFRECAQEKKMGATLLRGPAGVGKDYLAEWLCERAGELGVARVLRAYHEDAAELVDGMARMVRREFFLTGLRRADVKEFFRYRLGELGARDDYEWEAITELVSPADGTDSSAKVHFSTPQHRHMAMARFLERLTRQGPILLWLNDVQWGASALRFVRLFLEQPDLQAPIYIVMTGRDDLLSESSESSGELDRILENPEVETIEVGPLDVMTSIRLVEKALFLEPSAAYEVARRSGGNPTHALEMVGEWLDRNLLQPSRRGFVLDEDIDPGPPGEWIDVWSGVVERLVSKCPERRKALELGAILGEQLRRETWEAAAAIVGTTVPEEIVEVLLERKYLSETPMGMVFTQNMLREALFASARNMGRWEEMCEACARALSACVGRGEAVDERVGRLLIEAGEEIEGADHILRAAEERLRRREYYAMVHLSECGEGALRECTEFQAQILKMKLLLIGSHGCHGIREDEKALEMADRALTIAQELGMESWAGVAKMRKTVPMYFCGDVDEANKMGGEALESLGPGFERESAMACGQLIHIALRRGDHDKAIGYLEKARELLDGIEAPVERCNIEYVWLKARMVRGDELENDEIEDVVEQCRQAGVTVGMAEVCNLRAENARRKGELEDALSWYEKSISLRQHFDPDGALPARINIALVAIEKGDPVGGGLIAERTLQIVRRTKRPQMRLYSKAAMLPMQVVRGDFEEAREFIEDVSKLIEDLGVDSDPDLDFCLQKALDLVEDKTSQSALCEEFESALAKVGSDVRGDRRR